MKKSGIILLLLFVIILFQVNFLFSLPYKGLLRDSIIVFSIIASIIFYLKKEIENIYLRNQLILYIIYYLFLIGESMIDYKSIMVYPHIILVISNFFIVILFYVLSLKINPFAFLDKSCYFICGCIYLQDIIIRISMGNIIFYRVRVVPAYEVYLLLLCTVYFMCKYLEKKFLNIFLVIINLTIIFFENHRTVWISTIIAFLIFNFLISKVNSGRLKIRNFSIFIFGGVFLMGAFLFFSQEIEQPEFQEFMFERVEDIYKYSEQGTGKWRYNIYEYYLPYIKRNLLFGMRFSGFEIKTLYSGMFEEKTGHHFHSGYLPLLFYNGLIGLYLLYGPILYYIYRFFRSKKCYLETICLVSFIFSGFVYSISYNLPFMYFAFLGIGFAILDKR